MRKSTILIERVHMGTELRKENTGVNFGEQNANFLSDEKTVKGHRIC